jgi:hypothetical protein
MLKTIEDNVLFNNINLTNVKNIDITRKFKKYKHEDHIDKKEIKF